MAVPVLLIAQGLTLINFLLNLIWGEEVSGTDKTGREKHDFVQDVVEKFINDRGIPVKDLNGLIKGFVKLLNDHGIFGDNNDTVN
jgi:hypothetical protein